ncbi:MAG: ribonuclease P protein component [Clostridium sp.]|uniref:Ribonuclease P protein component n=1 Tax=Clostridium paraputrificum TaxID=29363 RepID=A0A6N3EGR6_9CLOT|nr:ribonuclease P protein component [Clostridium sp.]MBS5928067.1 ribonuclease P protein component [Clostridium sp.]
MIYRLKKNLEFRFIYRRGKSFANSLLVLYVLKNKMNKDREGNLYNKVGISVSKKVGNSVIRSRSKRLIYENYRFKDDYLNKGYDLVFVARTKLKDKNFNEVENAMDNLLKKAGLYNNEKISIKSNKIL